MARKRKFHCVFDNIHYKDNSTKTEASEHAITALHDQCFYVWPGIFTDDEIQVLYKDLKSIDEAKWASIFNPNRRRLQYNIENTTYSIFNKAIEFMKSVNSNLEQKN